MNYYYLLFGSLEYKLMSKESSGLLVPSLRRNGLHTSDISLGLPRSSTGSGSFDAMEALRGVMSPRHGSSISLQQVEIEEDPGVSESALLAMQQQMAVRKRFLVDKWRRRIKGCRSTGRAAIPGDQQTYSSMY